LPETIVCAEDLEKWFGKNQALKGVSFTIGRGDIYGFVGKNGAGKTTVMRILCGLMRQDRGRIRMAGAGVRKGDRGVFLGFLPQSIRFDDSESAGSLIRFFSRLKKADARKALRFASEIGLELDKKAKYLSPGQQRKLQLAVATIGNPELLVFDEPTAGLDPMGVQTIRNCIAELNRLGSTVFISSHVLSELDNLCGKVAVIDGGRILYQGPCGSEYELDTGETEICGEVLAKCGHSGLLRAAGGKIIAKVGRGDIPGLLGYLYENGVPVYGVKQVGLEIFYNRIVKDGA
jgi:ABC-2 type transport system ATP-binding protein